MTTNINVSDSGARDYTGRRTIAGLFTDRADAERAINDLKSAGFRPEDVGVAMRDRNQQNELVEEHGTKAAEGAGAGALGGGLLGGLVGFLVGIGALAIPGIGPVVAGGALATAFGLGGGTAVAGAGIGAAAGGIVGALVGMGIPEEEAQHFEAGFREGGVLVTVNASQRAMDALAILERNGADTGPGSVGSRAGSGAGSVRKDDDGAKETAGGAVAGAGAGAVAGTAIGGPGVGTAAGAVIGGAAGAASGKAVHEARDPAERDMADEGAAGGGLAGGAAG
ncbi:MAG TPA: general stress protein, partial [Chloroflexota bacterium]|nr:general stress protein [Chloroflexota bacterium]